VSPYQLQQRQFIVVIELTVEMILWVGNEVRFCFFKDHMIGIATSNDNHHTIRVVLLDQSQDIHPGDTINQKIYDRDIQDRDFSETVLEFLYGGDIKPVDIGIILETISD
jgi:hypothetical protein